MPPNSYVVSELIRLVKARPVIWDSPTKLKHPTIDRREAWKEIGKAMKINVNEAKIMWKRTRARYVIDMKRNSLHRHSTARFLKEMAFLLPMLKLDENSNSSRVNVKEEQMSPSSSSPTTNPTPSPTPTPATRVIPMVVDDQLPSAMRHFVPAVENAAAVADISQATSINSQSGTDSGVGSDDTWRSVFGQFIQCELKRYSYQDAQALKAKLTEACLRFAAQQPENYFN